MVAAWTGLVLFIGCINAVLCSPVPIEKGPKRESTKEILKLEQELKQQAGENKKFEPEKPEPPVVLPQVPVIAADKDGKATSDEESELADISALQDLDEIKPEDALQHLEVVSPMGSKDAEEDEPDVPVDEKRMTDDEENKQEEEEEEELAAEDEKNLYLQSLMEAIKANPELLRELQDVEYPEQEDTIQDVSDKASAVRAEYEAAMGDNTGNHISDIQSHLKDESHENIAPYVENPYEHEQLYRGDSSARVVSKKRGYSAPSEYAANMPYVKESGAQQTILEQEQAEEDRQLQMEALKAYIEEKLLEDQAADTGRNMDPAM